ncbi:hypothetical protein EJ06DRAFT_550928 [Trichodelitschia bisporula]|uniref:Uncharacterized protein n=1 Tax=Trichodelitschia bisporula TaxID=703511 RepID=A0A6G1HN98_9PEZI|nr:hypothetical protein EJ06DRAFT_550928 [Trichodelitschia bisporula]
MTDSNDIAMTDRDNIAMTDEDTAVSDRDGIAGPWDAVKNFRDATGVGLFDESLRRFSTADDVLKETVENESKFKKWRHDGERITKFRSVLKNFLDPLEDSSKDCVGCFEISAVFTAITLLVDAANNVSADYDKLLVIFDELNAFLGGLNVLKGHIPHTPEIRRCITDIFTTIITIIGLSMKAMKRGRIGGFARNIAGENKELTAAYKHLQLALSQEDRLSVTDYEEVRRKLLRGTATWTFEEPAFPEWERVSKPVLLLSGGPGCGKSLLSTKAIERLLEKADQQSGRDAVGYYYFHDNDPRMQSVLSALCTMVYQIADRNERFRVLATQTCSKSPTHSMATISSVWNDYIVSAFGPSSPCNLTLVFDGIDEAVHEDTRRFLDLLRDSLRDGKIGEVSLSTIGVSSESNFADIVRFIDDKYDMYIKISKSRKFRQQVTSLLRHKADGMFLWVDLMYREAGDIKQPKRLLKMLESTPSDLTAPYDRIFSRIEDQASSKVAAQPRELFSFVVHSNGSFSLLLNDIIRCATKDELFDAETIIARTCSSLFVAEDSAFLDELDSESETDNEAVGEDEFRVDGNVPRSSLEDAHASKDELDGLDSESESDNEAADKDEEMRLNSTYVYLRHASLGDYLRNSSTKSSLVISACDFPMYRVLHMRRIMYQVSDPPRSLWEWTLSNFLTWLSDLDEKTVSAESTALVVESLAEMFRSELTIKKIWYPKTIYASSFSSEHLFFGFSIVLMHPTRATVLKWLKRAVELRPRTLAPDILEWAHKIVEHPAMLLVSVSMVCITEWLDYEGNEDERFRIAWFCVSL